MSQTAITDEMVEAFRAQGAYWCMPSDAIIRRGLEAALANPQVGVKVKELEWQPSALRPNMLVAKSGFEQNYVITKLDDGTWWTIGKGFPTLEAARAAAQQDYETRILSAITLQGTANLSDDNKLLFEAITAIAEGEGDAQEIAQQTLAALNTHASDCALHNEPAYPAGECDCHLSALSEAEKRDKEFSSKEARYSRVVMDLTKRATAARRERDEWAAQAMREDDCRMMWQDRAEAAEKCVKELESDLRFARREADEIRATDLNAALNRSEATNKLLSERIVAKDEALDLANTALEDWFHHYAPDECNEVKVKESSRRIFQAGGTLAYLTDVFAVIRAAREGK